jgi:hypothetical protein
MDHSYDYRDLTPVFDEAEYIRNLVKKFLDEKNAFHAVPTFVVSGESVERVELMDELSQQHIHEALAHEILSGGDKIHKILQESEKKKSE